MRKSILAAAVYALLGAWAAGAFAGGWTQPKGEGYAKLALNYFESYEFVTRDHERQKLPDNGRFSDSNVSLYVDYGITQDLTGVFSTSFKHVYSKSDLENESTTGFGDIEAALKHKLFKLDPVVMSVQLLEKIPTYNENHDPPLGNGQYDTEIRLLAGWSMHPLPLYAGIEGGYRWRTEDPSDEWKFLLELGWRVTEKFFLRGKIDGTYSARNGDNVDLIANPTATNEYDLYKGELTAGWYVSKNGALEFSWAPVLYGRNTANGQTFSLGYSIGFGKSE